MVVTRGGGWVRWGDAGRKGQKSSSCSGTEREAEAECDGREAEQWRLGSREGSPDPLAPNRTQELSPGALWGDVFCPLPGGHCGMPVGVLVFIWTGNQALRTRPFPHMDSGRESEFTSGRAEKLTV